MTRDVLSYLKRGGPILVLPVILLAQVTGGFLLSESFSDNLYYQRIKIPGNITAVGGYLTARGFARLSGHGSVSIMAADPATLIFGGRTALEKTLFLKGVGNKNNSYLFAQTLYPTEIELYRYLELGAGDSVVYYIADRYRLTARVQYRRRGFASVAVRDYHQPEAFSAFSIPLPYCFTIPSLAAGVRMYTGENLLFGQSGLEVQVPLRPEFSMNASARARLSGIPTSVLPVDDSLASDELFAEANIHRSTDAEFSARYAHFRSRITVTGSIGINDRRFFPSAGVERNDQAVRGGILTQALINDHAVLSIGYDFNYNRSSVDDFDFTKHRVDIDLEWFW